jgi:hypothetical protein
VTVSERRFGRVGRMMIRICDTVGVSADTVICRRCGNGPVDTSESTGSPGSAPNGIVVRRFTCSDMSAAR